MSTTQAYALVASLVKRRDNNGFDSLTEYEKAILILANK